MYNKRFEVVRFDLNSNSFTNLKGHKQKIIQMLQLNNCAIKEECAATFSVDKTVKVWNIIKGEIMYDLYDTNTPVKGLEMPNGNMAVLYENKIVKLYSQLPRIRKITKNQYIIVNGKDNIKQFLLTIVILMIGGIIINVYVYKKTI